MRGDWANMQRQGSKNPSAKLTEPEVKVLRILMDSKLFTRASLAREFGVTRQTLIHIETGRNWGTV